MKVNGAGLVVFALEQIGVRQTFGIPGAHNIEIYNQLGDSKLLEPVLVTNEVSAGYMADAVSRTTDSIGTMVIVPGAGMTNALSAICEAFIDGIPLMIISGGIKREYGKSFQMHRLDAQKTLDGIVKKYYSIDNKSNIVQTIYDAYNTAIGGEPGPVFVEIPEEIQIAEYDSDSFVSFRKKEKEKPVKKTEATGGGMQLFAEKDSPELKLDKAVSIIENSKSVGIYVGWGAIDAYEEVKKLSELLAVPVATTFQGVSSFPYNHPMHTGIGFGKNGTTAGEKAFANCDCLLAIGLKFSELATFNYQLEVPENLIHIDINPAVFHKNFHAKVAIEGDSKMVLTNLIARLYDKSVKPKNNFSELSALIKKEKDDYKKSWLISTSEEKVTPGFFFNALRNNLPGDAVLVTDDGHHSLLALELFPVYQPRHFIGPTDYNCLGYGIPAAIGAKMHSKQKTVVSIIGQGALMMSGLELVTAFSHKLGIIVFVFKEAPLSQSISDQGLKSTNPGETGVGILSIKGLAEAVHAGYYIMKNDVDISGVINKAIEEAKTGKSVLVEVNIDYSRKSKLAGTISKPKFSRFRIAEKIRLLFKGGN